MAARIGNPEGEGSPETRRKGELAALIVRHIRARRLTQDAAAGMLGIEPATMAKIIRGQYGGLSVAQLMELVARLGATSP